MTDVIKILHYYDYYMKNYNFEQLKQLKMEMEANGEIDTDKYDGLYEAYTMKYEAVYC